MMDREKSDDGLGTEVCHKGLTQNVNAEEESATAGRADPDSAARPRVETKRGRAFHKITSPRRQPPDGTDWKPPRFRLVIWTVQNGLLGKYAADAFNALDRVQISLCFTRAQWWDIGKLRASPIPMKRRLKWN